MSLLSAYFFVVIQETDEVEIDVHESGDQLMITDISSKQHQCLSATKKIN